MDLLIDKTIRDFSGLLESSAPAPGGGSAAALSGFLATSLSMMVVNLSVGKKSYEALPGDVKARMTEDFEVMKRLNGELAGLIDEDTQAFLLFMEALRLPKETEEQRLRRSDAMQKAGEYALHIPLRVAEKCLMILRHQPLIAEHGNKNAASDIGVGALMALTGLEGAVLNVKINLPAIEDERLKREAADSINEALAQGRRLHAHIMKLVHERLETA